MDGAARLARYSRTFRIDDDVVHGPFGTTNRSGYDFDLYAVFQFDRRNLIRTDPAIAGRHHLLRSRQIGPQLKPVHGTIGIAFGHFLVDDAAAGGHPLNVTRGDHPCVAQAVPMFHIAFGDVGNRFYAAVRMPGKAFQQMRGNENRRALEMGRIVEIGYNRRHDSDEPRPLPSSVGGLRSYGFSELSACLPPIGICFPIRTGCAAIDEAGKSSSTNGQHQHGGSLHAAGLNFEPH